MLLRFFAAMLDRTQQLRIYARQPCASELVILAAALRDQFHLRAFATITS